MEFRYVGNREIPLFATWLSTTMKHELLLLKLSPKLDQATQRRLLKQGREATTELTPVLDEKIIGTPGWSEILQTEGIGNLCIEFELQGLLGDWPPESLRHVYPTIRNATAKRLAEVLGSLPSELNPYIKINLSSEHLSELATVLSFAMEKDVRYIFLDAGQMDLRSYAPVLKEIFNHLEIFSRKKSFIVFVGKSFQQWDRATLNVFSGPKVVDIDTSNSCTHNCTFCELYAPQSEKSKDITELKRKKIDEDTCMRFLDDLPPTTETLQFGGAGDPFTNPHIVHFITKALNRGFKLQLLTNFAYLTEETISELHLLAGRNKGSLHIIVNISGVTAETYRRTRPNQSEENFGKILRSLELSATLSKRFGKGFDLTLMFVACRSNFREITGMVRLGARLGVHSVWIKPMEVHGPNSMKLIIEGTEIQEYAKELGAALKLADELGVHLTDRFVMEKVIADHGDAPVGEMKEPGEDAFTTKVQNGMTAARYFSSHPCRIGAMFMRVSVDAEVSPCCVMKPIASLKGASLKEAWFSGAYHAFRSKLGRIHLDQFHLQDPEWLVCQQCPHLISNQNYNQHSTPCQ